MAKDKARLHEELRYYFDMEAPGEPLRLSLSEVWDDDERRAAYTETCSLFGLAPHPHDPHYVVIPVPEGDRARVLGVLVAHRAVNTTDGATFRYASDYRQVTGNSQLPLSEDPEAKAFSSLVTQVRASRIPKMTAQAFLASLYVPIFESGAEAGRLVDAKSPSDMADDLLYLQSSVRVLIAPHTRNDAAVLEAPLVREELIHEFTDCPPAERLDHLTRHVRELVGKIPATVGLASTRATTPDCINLRVFGEQSTPSMDKKRAEALSQVVGLLLTGRQVPFTQVHNEKLRVKNDQLPEQLVAIFKDLIEPSATPRL